MVLFFPELHIAKRLRRQIRNEGYAATLDRISSMSERPGIDVADSPDKRRYEAYVDGELAGYVLYQARPEATPA